MLEGGSLSLKVILLILACVLVASGCSGQKEPPVVMVGIDGAEWQIIDEMIADGELPNFAKIKSEGAWGHLINNGMETSPVVWTTFATGHFARTHGVLDHVFPFGGEGARRPVTSELRQVPALWNIATHYDLRSIVIGYFVSHPPEPINGVMVSSQAASWEKVLYILLTPCNLRSGGSRNYKIRRTSDESGHRISDGTMTRRRLTIRNRHTRRLQ